MPFPQPQSGILTTAANFTAQSSAYTAKAGDFVLASVAVAFTVTLPPASLGAVVTVRSVLATAAVTVKTADGSTIDGVAGTTGIAYSTLHSGATFVSDGTNWWVAGS